MDLSNVRGPLFYTVSVRFSYGVSAVTQINARSGILGSHGCFDGLTPPLHYVISPGEAFLEPRSNRLAFADGYYDGSSAFHSASQQGRTILSCLLAEDEVLAA